MSKINQDRLAQNTTETSSYCPQKQQDFGLSLVCSDLTDADFPLDVKSTFNRVVIRDTDITLLPANCLGSEAQPTYFEVINNADLYFIESNFLGTAAAGIRQMTIKASSQLT